MSKLDTLIDNKVFQNVVVWGILFFLIAITITADNKWIASLFVIGILAPPIYVSNFYILPYFKNKPWKFLGLFLLNTIVFSLISVYIVGLALGKHQFKSIINFLGILLLALSFAAALKIARDSFVRRQEEKKAELYLLKAQLNPHFLFNTLNNLYGLSVVKSDKLPGLMLKLSDLLRYSLYDTSAVFVSLEKEIKYLENYISLERIRLENVEIEMSIQGAINEKKIAPMLLIVFVENAFKHLGGAKECVKISMVVTESELHFSCMNTAEEIPSENLETGKSGIGLKNAKKRLTLLYPNNHTLKVNKEENSFLVDLKLNF
ncbi:sensor histidine kinase [uncultured Tenacibaculum sp.]|uniref:sensor histidine kinase n=1 Tax=uncultured Tenacibaculum sp. TaxID=174713 RepID=UPI00262F4267|nr:sensor histidine kinase [uncultured Tenacibaculum sp.]